MGLFTRRAKAHKLQSLQELVPMLESDRPVLIDFYQVGCAPCQVMDGIMNELANEYADTAHIVKADIYRVPGAIEAFGIRSTPTLMLLGRAPEKKSKKARRGGGSKDDAEDGTRLVGARWRTSGLVKKDQLVRLLEGNGAAPLES